MLLVTRSTRVADTSGPSTPTITAATATSSTITITRTVNATDASGVAFYETQRSAAGANSWTTFDSSSTNPLTAAGLSAGTAYDFRQRAIDIFGNAGSYSAVTSASTQPNSGEWADQYGTISELELALSVDGRRFGVRAPTLAGFGPNVSVGNGGSLTYLSGASFDGAEPAIEFRPPSVSVGGQGLYCTICASSLQRGGLNNIKQMNVRWLEWIGPRYWDLSVNLRPKWSGFFISADQTAELNTNRVGIFDAPNTIGTVYPCVTATTVQTYNYPPEGYNVNVGADSTKLIAIRGTNNHSLNAPQTGGGEWVCFEQVVDCMQNRGNPFGRHELRVWTRDRVANGRFLRISLDWDATWNFARQFIITYEGLGAYFNGTATPHADNYKLWSHVAFAANMGIDDLIGPPPGF